MRKPIRGSLLFEYLVFLSLMLFFSNVFINLVTELINLKHRQQCILQLHTKLSSLFNLLKNDLKVKNVNRYIIKNKSYTLKYPINSVPLFTPNRHEKKALSYFLVEQEQEIKNRIVRLEDNVMFIKGKLNKNNMGKIGYLRICRLDTQTNQYNNLDIELSDTTYLVDEDITKLNFVSSLTNNAQLLSQYIYPAKNTVLKLKWINRISYYINRCTSSQTLDATEEDKSKNTYKSSKNSDSCYVLSRKYNTLAAEKLAEFEQITLEYKDGCLVIRMLATATCKRLSTVLAFVHALPNK